MSTNLKIHRIGDPKDLFEVVTIPVAELQILRTMGNQKMIGFEIVKNSNGKVKLGGVYTLLGRLEDKGLVAVEEVPVEGLRRTRTRVFYVRTFDSEEEYFGRLVMRPE